MFVKATPHKPAASCKYTQFDWSHSQASPSSSFHHLRCAKLEVDGLGTFITLRVDSEGVSTKRDSRGKQKSCHLLTKRKKLYRWETCSFSGQLTPPPLVPTSVNINTTRFPGLLLLTSHIVSYQNLEVGLSLYCEKCALLSHVASRLEN